MGQFNAITVAGSARADTGRAFPTCAGITFDRLSGGGLVFPVTIDAVNRTAGARLKRDFGRFAAGGADSGIHLAVGSGGSSATLGLPGSAAGRAALRLVSIAFLRVKFLFPCGECEGSSAIGATKRLILETHG